MAQLYFHFISVQALNRSWGRMFHSHCQHQQRVGGPFWDFERGRVHRGPVTDSLGFPQVL